ncbi:MAG: hypothetical protein KBC95_02970 [Candidatus Peribacteraceae bacterium]|nr:hypothetical protein [Candidatus Peribacteraceae bacterium]
MPFENDPLADPLVLTVMALAVLAIAAVVVFLQIDKRPHYRRLHKEKRDAGQNIVRVEQKPWSHGRDWILTYTDGSTITVEDEPKSPLAWIAARDDHPQPPPPSAYV